MDIISLAFKNIFRNKRRTAYTLLSIVAGIVALVLFDGFVRYTLWGLRESTIKNGYGHLQIATDEQYFVSGNFDPYNFLIQDQNQIISKIKKLPEVKEVVPEFNFSATLASNEKSGIIMVQAVPPDISTTLLSFRSVIDGRDLLPEDQNQIVLANGVAQKLNAKIGDTLTMMAVTKGGGLNAVDVTVVGIASMGLRELDNIMVYMNLKSVMDFLMVDSVPLLIVVLEQTEDTDNVYQQIMTNIKTQLKQPFVVKKWFQLADYYRQVEEFYKSMLSIIRLIIVLVVIFAIANTMTMAVFERTREIGTLRALGTKKHRVVMTFLLEGVWIGLIGGFVGVILGIGLSSFINVVFGGVYIPPPPGMATGYQALLQPNFETVWQSMLLALTVSALASIYPAIKATKLHIADALRFI